MMSDYFNYIKKIIKKKTPRCIRGMTDSGQHITNQINDEEIMNINLLRGNFVGGK